MKFRMNGGGTYFVHGRKFVGGNEYETDDPYVMRLVSNTAGFTVIDFGNAPELAPEPEPVEEDLDDEPDDEFRPIEEFVESDDGVEEVVIAQPRNEFGKFDCRIPGCNRVGEAGFATERGARTHERRCAFVKQVAENEDGK